jgi:cytidine deaminase
MSIKSPVNWDLLHQQAAQVCKNAYAPYSHFTVGAALQSTDDQIFVGCNVENASYGLTVCAERNCIASAVAHGVQDIKALVVFTPQIELTTPCGACRQVIAEFMSPDSIVGLVNHLGETKRWLVSELLPAAFTPKSLVNVTQK